jgi:hypothetical protein
MPLIHSAGAGLSLAAAGTTVLLGASTLVAFNGWPGMREPVPSAPVRLAAAPPPLREAGSDIPAVATVPRVRLRTVAAPGRARSHRVVRTGVVIPSRGEGSATTRLNGPSTGTVARKPSQSPGSQEKPAPPAIQTPPAPTTEQVQQTVQEAVKPVTEVVPPLQGELERRLEPLTDPR